MAENEKAYLFPKISGKIEELLGHVSRKGFKEDVLQLTGTVKLHGAHADIVVFPDNTIKLQTRNRSEVTLETDHRNFAQTILPLQQEILALKTQYHARFKSLNPNTEIDNRFPLIIAGEWIGPGVQSKVAISYLPSKYFVIISASINGEWVEDRKYANIADESVGIYNISRSGFFTSELKLRHNIAKYPDGQEYNRITCTPESKEELQILTAKIENECPFAKTFGIEGRGEGLVWKVAHPLSTSPNFWLKTKGEIFQVTSRQKLVKLNGAEGKEKAKIFAKATVSVQRLEQGISYLEEMGYGVVRDNITRFLKWLFEDIEVEESRVIEELGVSRLVLRHAVEFVGRPWFLERVEEREGG